MSVGDFWYALRHRAKLSAPQAIALDAAIAAAEESSDVTTAQSAADDAQTDADTLKAACIVVAVDDADDVGSGGTTQTVGLQLNDQDGSALAAQHLLTFGGYADANGSAAANGTLATATAGTIISGSGTAELKVLTDAAGKFTCTLTNAVDEAVHLIAGPTIGSPILDCRDSDSVTFSA